MQYTMQQIQYLAAASENGNPTTAAVLHGSQSSAWSAIARLEKAFQVQFLVHHQAKGVSIASAGTHI